VTNVAHSFDDAEAWDIEFWQSRGRDERINALEELRADWDNISHANN